MICALYVLYRNETRVLTLNRGASSSPSTALATRTPRAVQRIAEHVPLPASPAQMADAIDRQSIVIQAKVNALVEKSGVVEGVEYLRNSFSTVDAISTGLAIFEGLALSRTTMPWKHAFDIPPIEAIGTSRQPIKLPDLFQLVTPHFWYTSLAWGTSSLIIPLVFAYFFNFTRKARQASGPRKLEYNVDPMTFHLAKLILTFAVYGQGYRLFGFISEEVAKDVRDHIVGGSIGMATTALIGLSFAFYEPILRR